MGFSLKNLWQKETPPSGPTPAKDLGYGNELNTEIAITEARLIELKTEDIRHEMWDCYSRGRSDGFEKHEFNAGFQSKQLEDLRDSHERGGLAAVMSRIDWPEDAENRGARHVGALHYMAREMARLHERLEAINPDASAKLKEISYLDPEILQERADAADTRFTTAKETRAAQWDMSGKQDGHDLTPVPAG